MHVAAYNGHYLIVKFLMEEKAAKFDLTNRNKQSPAAYLHERIQKEITKFGRQEKKLRSKAHEEKFKQFLKPFHDTYELLDRAEGGGTVGKKKK